MANRSDYGKNAEYLDLLWSNRRGDVQFYVEEAAKFQKRHWRDVDYGRILELGFGTGRVGFQIAMQNRMAVYGIEKSANMIRYAKSRLKDLPVLQSDYVWISESDCMDPHPCLSSADLK